MLLKEIKETFEMFETLFKWKFTEPVCKDFLGFKWSYDIYTKNGLTLTKQQVKQAYAKLLGYETFGPHKVECYYFNNKKCSRLKRLMLKSFYQAFIFGDNVFGNEGENKLYETPSVKDDGNKKKKKQRPNAIFLFKKLFKQNLKTIIEQTNENVRKIFEDSIMRSNLRNYHVHSLNDILNGMFSGSLMEDKKYHFVDINKHIVQVICEDRVFFLVDDIYQLFVDFLNSRNNEILYRWKPSHVIEKLKELFPNGISGYKFGTGNDFVDDLFLDYFRGNETIFNRKDSISWIFRNETKQYKLSDKSFAFELVW